MTSLKMTVRAASAVSAWSPLPLSVKALCTVSGLWESGDSQPLDWLQASKIKQNSFPPTWPLHWLLSSEQPTDPTLAVWGRGKSILMASWKQVEKGCWLGCYSAKPSLRVWGKAWSGPGPAQRLHRGQRTGSPLWLHFKTHLSLFSCSVVSDSLQPHLLQHTRVPCPSASPRVCSNSCPLHQGCHPTISSFVAPFSSRLQFFPASGSFPVSCLCASGGQSIGASASASVLPINIQDWFPQCLAPSLI